MTLSEGCELVYIVRDEVYYRDTVHHEKSIVIVSAEDHRGGGAWEFSVEQHQLTTIGPILRLRMFGDSWNAFEQIPEFFTALREECPTTLGQLRSLLDRIGARDATKRVNPDEMSTR